MKTISIIVTSVILSMSLLHAKSNDMNMKENDSSMMKHRDVMNMGDKDSSMMKKKNNMNMKDNDFCMNNKNNMNTKDKDSSMMKHESDDEKKVLRSEHTERVTKVK